MDEYNGFNINNCFFNGKHFGLDQMSFFNTGGGYSSKPNGDGKGGKYDVYNIFYNKGMKRWR